MTDLPPDLEALLFDAAAGDLTPEDAERLRGLIDADPSLAGLVDEQRSVAEAVATAPMTEIERARLHRGVGAATAPERAVPAPWVRWAFAAAAVVVVVVAGGFALLNSGLGDTFDDMSAEVGTIPTAVVDGGATDGADRYATDEAEESAPGDGEADTALVPEAGDDAADSAGSASMPFPACPGEVESVGDFAEETEAMTQGWPNPEDAAAALDDVPGTWALYAGDPVVETIGDVAIVSWSDDAGLLQQVELQRSGDLWSVTRRVTCSG
jgi:hypothetical protein